MKLLKPTAMSLVALAFAVPAFLPTGLSAQSKPATAVEATQAIVTTSNNSQKKDPTPVRVVCLSTAPENFFVTKILQNGRGLEKKESESAFKELGRLKQMRIEAGLEWLLTPDGGMKAAGQKLRQLYPPIGEYFYIPLGTGFVVDEMRQHVVTNWHVADLCPQSELFKTQLGIIETSEHGALEYLRAELQGNRNVLTENGTNRREDYTKDKIKVICADKSIKCSVDTPSDVAFFVPDLALLKLNKGEGEKAHYARTAPILLDLNYKENVFKDKSSTLLITGYPQLVMSAGIALNPSRQATNAVSTPASYSNSQTFSNHVPGRALKDQVETDLMLLAAQIHRGNSGGPVLLNDKVIGVVTNMINTAGTKRAQSDQGSVESSSNAFTSAVPAGYGLAVNVKEVIDMLQWFNVKPAGIAAAIPSPTPVPSPVPAPVICKTNEVKVDGKCELVPTPFWKSPLILGLLGLITIVAGTFFWMIRSNKEKVTKEPAILNPNTVIHVENPKPQDVPVRKADTLVAVRLRGSHGNFNDKVFSIPTPNGVNALMVGRDPAVCQITFPNQLDTVSKRHCIFNWIQATRTFTVEDLGSTWGTFVNGKKIVKGEKVTLKNGDTVDLAADKTNRFSVEIV